MVREGLYGSSELGGCPNGDIEDIDEAEGALVGADRHAVDSSGRTVADLARRSSANCLLILKMHSTAHNAAKDHVIGGSSSSCSEIAVPQVNHE
eukprot:9740942-Heterocapsa_arctica.AAC.1